MHILRSIFTYLVIHSLIFSPNFLFNTFHPLKPKGKSIHHSLYHHSYSIRMLNDHEPSKRGHDNSYLINRTRVSVNTSGNTNFASTTSRSRKSDEPNYAQLKKDAPGLMAAAAHAAVPSWTSMVLMVSLIFGGCCANVGV
jgi:hypothetical protein